MLFFWQVHKSMINKLFTFSGLGILIGLNFHRLKQLHFLFNGLELFLKIINFILYNVRYDFDSLIFKLCKLFVLLVFDPQSLPHHLLQSGFIKVEGTEVLLVYCDRVIVVYLVLSHIVHTMHWSRLEKCCQLVRL